MIIYGVTINITLTCFIVLIMVKEHMLNALSFVKNKLQYTKFELIYQKKKEIGETYVLICLSDVKLDYEWTVEKGPVIDKCVVWMDFHQLFQF